MGVFLWNFCIFSEHLFLGKPLEECFWLFKSFVSCWKCNCIVETSWKWKHIIQLFLFSTWCQWNGFCENNAGIQNMLYMDEFCVDYKFFNTCLKTNARGLIFANNPLNPFKQFIIDLNNAFSVDWFSGTSHQIAILIQAKTHPHRYPPLTRL